MDERNPHSSKITVGFSDVDQPFLPPISSDSHAAASTQGPSNPKSVSQVLQEFLPMIRRIAGAMAIKNPFLLDVEDLTSAGAMGLLSALKRFDPTRDASFRTFAEYRIRGMMLDEIRAMDWVPRSVRSRRDQIRHMIQEHVHTHDRPPTPQELAFLLGIPIEQLEGIEGCDPKLISLDEPVGQREEGCTIRDVLPDAGHQDPFMACLESEMKAALNAALANLSERQQEILHLYYHAGLTMKEIGNRVGLTESGVCRVHSTALRHLRLELKDMKEEGTCGIRPRNLRKPRVQD